MRYIARVALLAAVVAAAGCARPSARLEAFGEVARPLATNALPSGGWWELPAARVAEDEL